MTLNFPDLLLKPVFNVFARPITFTPVASQPGGSAYVARGYYGTEPLDVIAENGTVFSDQRTFVDIIDAEFSVAPQQGDLLNISADGGMPTLGDFEILDCDANGGGLTSLTLRKVMKALP